MSCDVVCIGEASVGFVPTEPGVALAEVSSFRKAAGGAPANAAVGLARPGVASAFIGMVGDDPFGEYLVRTLAAAGVDVTAMRRSSQSLTSVAFVSSAEDGGDDFLFYRQPGADTLLWHDQLELAVVTHGEKGCTWISRNSTHQVESFEVDSVDPTGAGDGFTAAPLVSIVANPDCVNDPDEVSRACRFANAVGALTVAGWGGIPALPVREDVARLVNEG